MDELDIKFIERMNQIGATPLPRCSDRAVDLAQSALQQMRAAMMPQALTHMYKNISGGYLLGDAVIFGLEEIYRAEASYSLPGLLDINREISGYANMRGRTLLGRNSLFWLYFDAFGKYYMADNVNMNVLREYVDMSRAIEDCLIVGKL